MQAHYGLCVADVAAGRLSLRRLAVLLKSMPLDGTALWRASRRAKPVASAKVVDPPAEWWTAERDLLAAILDRLNVLVWQPTENGRKGINPPQPTRRPGSQVPARAADPAKVVAALLKMSGRDAPAA